MTRPAFTLKLRKNLNMLLRKNEMTAAQLSRKSGISKQVISDWLAGTSPKNITQVATVADILGVTVDALCLASEADLANNDPSLVATNVASRIPRATIAVPSEKWNNGQVELMLKITSRN